MRLMPAFGLLFLVLPSFCDENLKPPAQTATTQRINFVPTGAIQVSASRGDLYVEAWDQPVVEVNVKKFMPFEYAPGDPERSKQQLEAVKVTVEQPKPGELHIGTTPAKPLEFWWPRSWAPNLNPVRLEYHIHVPRASRLEIHHGIGLVSVSGVTGDIRATGHRGDIVLWLPESGNYAIDARNKFGKVSSDFEGRSKERFIVGQKFTNEKAAAVQHLYLRMGFGGITLKPIVPESEPNQGAVPKAK